MLSHEGLTHTPYTLVVFWRVFHIKALPHRLAFQRELCPGTQKLAGLT